MIGMLDATIIRDVRFQSCQLREYIIVKDVSHSPARAAATAIVHDEATVVTAAPTLEESRHLSFT